MILLAKFLIAHMLGDFLFQPSGWIKDKRNKKGRSIFLYLHCLIHGVLLAVITWFSLPLWIYLIYTLAHTLIDLSKLSFQKERTAQAWFFIDQILHLFSIVAIWIIWDKTIYNEWSNFRLPPVVWIIISGYLFVSTPAAFIIQHLLLRWSADIENHTKSEPQLRNAGKYIGIIERFLILTFILINQWSAVGFLITAKSVFRFNDLKNSIDRKLTEYIIIGTFLSFGVVVMVGLLTKNITNL